MLSLDAQIARQNLSIIGAANRAAGLDGFIGVVIDQSGGSKERITLASHDLENLDGETLNQVLSGNVDSNVYVDEADALINGNPHNPTNEAVLLYQNMILIEADGSGDLEQRKEKAWKKAQPNIDQLRDHAEFLNGLGLFARLDKGHWEHDDNDDPYRWVNLRIAAILSKPVKDSRLHEAIYALSGLSENDDAEPSYLPLTLPLFRDLDLNEVASGAAAIHPDELVKLSERWLRSGRVHANFNATGQQRLRVRGREKLEWLVNGYIPMGMLTMVVGNKGARKSTSLHELALLTVTPLDHAPDGLPPTWLGAPLNKDLIGGSAAYFTGEESEADLTVRASQICGDYYAELMMQRVTRDNLPQRLDDVAHMSDLRLVVIDSASTFRTGDENATHTWQEFIDLISRPMEKTGCAVVFTHHLSGKEEPKSLTEAYDKVRGVRRSSQGVRQVFAIYKSRTESNVVYAGVCASNVLPDNSPAMEERAFRQDQQTRKLIPTGPVQGDAVQRSKKSAGTRKASATRGRSKVAAAEPASASPVRKGKKATATLKRRALVDQMLDCVTQANVKGQPIAEHELHERFPEELGGCARSSIKWAVSSAISSNQLAVQEDGCLRVLT